ncbi:uncharacterized protein LOC120358433 isoform X1 [Solenopsis invicta]|uniref:uncharacterized protein LOC120358433 isoform X1 n=1 Tax=Solenopsis invicta TaxID=13686 RepID=UPI00193E5AA1|nr:uncharacterized protein LOC120358433 isoform X1 [Solenopsis invicta]
MRRQDPHALSKDENLSVTLMSLSRKPQGMSIETLSKKTGVEFACGWNRYTMTILGIWPAKRSLSQASSYIVIAPVSMLCFVCVSQSANLPYVWSDFDLLVDNLSLGNVMVTMM